MADTQRIKEAAERALAALSADPSLGAGTATTTVRVRDGLTVDIEDGAWKLVGDEGKGDGGNGEGPDPGVFGRAALGSCLAIGYMTWAAVRGVSIESLTVDVEADYDAAGTLGIDAARPVGWAAMRYTVRVTSSAPANEIEALIDEADKHSSILHCFTEPLPISRTVQISAPAG